MAIEVTINGIPFNIPTEGAQGWGEEMTSWCVTVTEELNNLIAFGDIPLTSTSIESSQPTAALVPGLKFDLGTVKGAFVEYNIQRSDDTVRYTETGMLILTYNETTLTWDIARYHAGQSGPETHGTLRGVEFTVANEGAVGQVRYTSEPMVGANYAGQIRFRARVIK